jgi:hypothetical protein
VLGSQIAGSFKRFRSLARGEDAESIVKAHLEEQKKYIREVQKFLESL